MINFYSQNSLHEACLKKNIEEVKSLLATNADINAKDDKNFTALHIACFLNLKDIAQELINQNVDIDGKPEKEKIVETPLHLAALKNNHELIKLLLKNGADINAEDPNKITPLCYAVWGDSKEAITTLLLNGADINFNDKDQKILAIHNQKLNSKEIQSVLKKTKKAEDLLLANLNKNNPEKVREALQKYEELGLKDRINFLKEKQNFPSFIINGQGNIEQKMAIIKLLSANKINITETNAKGDNLISLALKKGDLALMQAIYEYSDFDSEKLLQQAVKKIQSIKKQPASCFSCLSSGKILTINFVKEVDEFRSKPPVEVKLENKLRTKLQEAFDEKELMETGFRFATTR